MRTTSCGLHADPAGSVGLHHAGSAGGIPKKYSSVTSMLSPRPLTFIISGGLVTEIVLKSWNEFQPACVLEISEEFLPDASARSSLFARLAADLGA
jgi:hypothetical protein